MVSRDALIESFQDTLKLMTEDSTLRTAVDVSTQKSKVYREDEPLLTAASAKYDATTISVTGHRTLQAAGLLLKDRPGRKVAIHNFASATNPGGGVVRGSRAQEECLCRCSTLYPILQSPVLLKDFYQYHRIRHDVLYSDTCIYTPGVVVFKTDEDLPRRFPKPAWYEVDVVTCAAPNLRPIPYNRMNPGVGEAAQISDTALLVLHRQRARHLLAVAAANGADILVLGAFGCGAFMNPPRIVAKAYADVLPEFSGRFEHIEFAVYCRPGDDENYRAFRDVLSPSQR